MKRFLSLLTIGLLLNQLSFGRAFQVVGSRALGMGGAQVAVAEGASAQYWNPGALGLTMGSGFQIPVNVSAEATGNLLQTADDISKLATKINDIQDKQQTGTSQLTLEDVKNFNDAVTKVLALNEPGTGALIDANGGLQNRFGKIAVSFNEYVDASAHALVDPSFNLGAFSGGAGIALDGTAVDPTGGDPALVAARDSLASIVQNMHDQFGVTLNQSNTNVANQIITVAQGNLSSSEIINLINSAENLNSLIPSTVSGTGALHDNASSVILGGVAMSELTLGYGHTIPINPKFGLLSLGGNIKALKAEVGFAHIRVIDGEETSFSDALRDARKNTKTSLKPSADLGLLYRTPFKHRLQFGVLGRNINSPTFDTPDQGIADGFGKYKEDAQWRAGTAFWPMERWMLSADIDIAKNPTLVPGNKSQTWGLGTEFKIWLLDLRAGLMKNFEAKGPLTYTGGFGLNIWALKVDLAGAVSSKTVKTDSGQEVPAYAQVGLNIGMQFGLGQEAKKPKLKAANEMAIPETPATTDTTVSPKTAPVAPAGVPVSTTENAKPDKKTPAKKEAPKPASTSPEIPQ